jgi:hypothetical protein
MIETVLNTIASFDDSLQLNVFYKKILDNFMPIKKEIDAFIQTGRPMNEFPEYLCNRVIEDPQLIDLNNLSYSSPHPELKAMAQKLSDLQKALLEDKQAVDKDYLLKQIRMNFVFNTFSSLIDTYMLHQLYQKQLVADESNLICICAGLGHVYNIEQILPELGYELIVAQQDNNNAVDIDIDILMPSHPVQGLLNHFYRLCGQCATLLGF